MSDIRTSVTNQYNIPLNFLKDKNAEEKTDVTEEVKTEALPVATNNKNDELPKEIKDLLQKYLETGCTKEEIMTVLDAQNVQPTVDGNKITFEYAGKTYTLTATETNTEISNTQINGQDEKSFDISNLSREEIEELIKEKEAELGNINEKFKHIEAILSEIDSDLRPLSILTLKMQRDIYSEKITKLESEIKLLNSNLV